MAGEALSVERWREIERLFDAVAELEPAARRRYLDEACRGDEELRGRVESLLATDADAGAILACLEQALAGASRLPPEPRVEGGLVGTFRLLEKLGEGGMGVVYKAYDLRLDRLVALKFLLACPRGEAKRRLIEEARAAASLDHPNVCTVYDVGETPEGRVFLATAFCEGETLEEKLKRGPLAPAEAIELAAQMAAGLAAAHRRGVVHRDVKPSNILVSPGGCAKLVDFGIASLPGGAEPGVVRGTPAYLAPEQARGEGADARADLWSLGVVLYEMLAGRRLFQGESARAVLEHILDEEPVYAGALRAGVPEAHRRVVARLLARDPDRRYPCAEALLADLEALKAATAPAGAVGPGRMGRRIAVTTLAFLLAGLGWTASHLWTARLAGPAAGLEVAEAVVVLPFTVRGQVELGYLREGMVELLSTRLDGAGDIRGVDPNALLAFVRRDADGEPDVPRGRAVAAHFRAGRFILGNVLDLGGTVRLSAFLYDTEGRLLAHEEVVAADEGVLLAALDELARRLLARLLSGEPGGRLGGLAARTTDSLPALRAYLAGEEAMRDGRFERAEQAYRQAVALDETFALAWYRLARAASWTQSPIREPALEQALRYDARLGERDRLLVRATEAWQVRRAAAEAEALYRQLLARYPDDAEAWQMLGEVIYHHARRWGRSPAEARLPLERALFYLPGHRETLIHLLDIALKERRFDDFEALAKPFLEARPGDPEGWLEASAYRALRALVLGADRERVIAQLRPLGSRVLAAAMWRTAGLLEDLESAQRMAEVLLGMADSPASEASARDWLWRIALARGRIDEAEAACGEPIPPGHRLVSRALLYAHPFSPYPAARLPGLEREVLAWDPLRAPLVELDGRPMHPGEEEVIRSYLLGLLAARRGDGEAVERQRRALDERSGTGELAPLLAQMLAASEAWRQGRDGEALAALDRARAASERIFLAGGESTFTTYLLNADFPRAELLARQGHAEEALRLYQTLTDGSDAGLSLLAPSHLRRAQIAEALGDAPRAAFHYRRFADLWSACDPELRPQVVKAEGWLADRATAPALPSAGRRRRG